MTRRRKLTRAEREAKAERNARRNRAGLLRARDVIAEHAGAQARAGGAGLELAGQAGRPLPPAPDVDRLRAFVDETTRTTPLSREEAEELGRAVLLGPDGRPLR